MLPGPPDAQDRVLTLGFVPLLRVPVPSELPVRLLGTSRLGKLKVWRIGFDLSGRQFKRLIGRRGRIRERVLVARRHNAIRQITFAGWEPAERGKTAARGNGRLLFSRYGHPHQSAFRWHVSTQA